MSQAQPSALAPPAATPEPDAADFEVAIVHGAAEVGEAAWDRLSAGRPFTSYRWYRFGEAAMAEERPLYIILSYDGEPVARATFFLTGQELLPVNWEPLRRLVLAVLRRWPLMLCRSPLSSVSGLVLPDPPLRDAALRRLTAVAEAQARRHHALFLVYDYLAEHEAQYPGWPEALRPFTFAEPGTRLDIAWPDFAHYLDHLSRKTRKSYRRNWRAAEEMGIMVCERAAVTRIDEALGLIRNVEAKYRSSPNPWTRGILENAGMVESVWITAEMGDRLVGCELMLRDGDAWCVMALGRDYAVPIVYFLLGYTDIRRAIESGAKALRWGSGAFDTKERLGFQPELNQYVLFTAHNRLLRGLARLLTTTAF
ncbi:MAG: hypothetical protein Kow00120_23040 [Anaerolineae bacterium]